MYDYKIDTSAKDNNWNGVIENYGRTREMKVERMTKVCHYLNKDWSNCKEFDSAEGMKTGKSREVGPWNVFY